MTASPPELVDVIDLHDRVTATVARSVMRRDRLLHRAVYVAVFHHDGRLLIHRRSDDKDIWPGWWDVSVGGVVTAGETWEAAVQREVAEEIGVHEPVPEPVGGGVYEDRHLHVLGRTFRLTSAGPFTFVDHEIVEAEWIATSSLTALVRERRFLPDSLSLLGPTLGL